MEAGGDKVRRSMVDTDDLRETALAEQHASVATVAARMRRASMILRQIESRRHHARRWLRRGLLALIYAPAVALLLLGATAAVGLLGDLWRLARALTTHALDTVPTTYDRLALAGRVALVSGAFLMLLCALVVVAVGCRGRRWWRLYLLPGGPLSAAAALIFIYAVQWCMLAANLRLGWSAGVWQTLTALALADAVLVAARIGGIGAGPLGTRRARLRSRLRGAQAASVRTSGRPDSRQTRPIPVVRFGPRETGVPVPAPDLPAMPDTAPSIPGVPTAEELRAVAGVAMLASAPHDDAHATPIASNIA